MQRRFPTPLNPTIPDITRHFFDSHPTEPDETRRTRRAPPLADDVHDLQRPATRNFGQKKKTIEYGLAVGAGNSRRHQRAARGVYSPSQRFMRQTTHQPLTKLISRDFLFSRKDFCAQRRGGAENSRDSPTDFFAPLRLCVRYLWLRRKLRLVSTRRARLFFASGE